MKVLSDEELKKKILNEVESKKRIERLKRWGYEVRIIKTKSGDIIIKRKKSI
jgi:biotin operon repressor